MAPRSGHRPYTEDLTRPLSRLVTPHGGQVSGGNCNTNAGGTDITDIAYDSAGKVTSITYQNGSSSAAVTVSFATQTPITTTADGVTRFTDPFGQDTTYNFNPGDHVTKVVDPINDTQSSSYNLNGDVTASVSPNNFTGGTDPSTTATYDGNFNRTKVTIPTGASISATFGNSTQPALPDTTTDDRGKSTTFTRSAGGGAKSTTSGTISVTTLRDGDSDPVGGATVHCGPSGTAAYKDAVCEVRDADYSSSTSTQHRTKYSYDSLGELTSVTPPTPANGRTTAPNQTFAYDGQSRIQAAVSGRSKTTSYTFDALDRVTKITYNDGHHTDFVYDEDGDLLSETDKTSSGTVIASENYTYDAMNRPASETRNGQSPTSTTWDGNSNLLTFTDSTGTTNYGYDSAGHLTSVTLPGGTCTGFSPTNPPTTASKCIIFAIDKSGNRLTTIYPGNLARQDLRYDTDGRITQATGTGQSSGTGTTFFDFTYDYGSTDTMHLAKRTDAVSNTSVTYAYTDQERLFTATDKNSAGTTTNVRTYCYDNNGNLVVRNTGTTTVFNCAGTKTFSYDGANQQLTGPDGASSAFTYDLDGDETGAATALPSASTTRTDTWTDSDQLASVALNGGSAASSTYLGAGNDLLLTSGVSATDYDQLRNSQLGVTQIDRFTSTGLAATTNITRDPQGLILSLRDNATGNRYYPLYDNQGSVLRIVDASGNTADAYSYDPYGTRTISTNTYQQPFGYTNAYTNPTSGLLHDSARYYDPTLARFIQTDPQIHTGDINQASPYPYAGDDPINGTDLSGRASIGTDIAVGGALVAGGGIIALAGAGGLAFLVGASTSGLETGALVSSAVGALAAVGGAIGSALDSIF